MQHQHLVIMAGGIGSRFWPLSTPGHPKQFMDILGCGRSLIQLTFDRFAGICPPENVWVVTNAAYVDVVKEQLPGIPEHHVLAEPMGRNTAPCIAWACWVIHQEDPEANVVVTPSDAVVMNVEEFRQVMQHALRFTQAQEAIVTVGIHPTRPETGYGYVHCGDVVDGAIHQVAAFKEKPDRKTAEAYLAEGNYLWNAGIFVWNVRTIRHLMTHYQPAIAALMDSIVSTGDVAKYFPQCEKISIDYAVMEPAAADGKVYTHLAHLGWSDLGNWASLHDKLVKDEAGNVSVGAVQFHECRDCMVHVEDARRVVLQGLEGYIVAEKDGALLICRREEEQRIKEFLQAE